MEVLDMVLVSCDSRTCLVDFEIWSEDLVRPAIARAKYTLGAKELTVISVEDPSHVAVASCPECLADVREAVLYERDLNREKN